MYINIYVCIMCVEADVENIAINAALSVAVLFFQIRKRYKKLSIIFFSLRIIYTRREKNY